ncbi:hypothetical protein M2281_001271 [Mesorhizobium soli]|uniref:hypothetical protein n=1 Tax=Pseudaminobacter soli (ex Li et al. 2025) TaxID=1295366 RepID=UPI00247455CB|nr:hypothetical protein [Mesorhizobium soli]MDH6230699.1 hypothetical protein [Mesorhizobium soli]
MPISFRNRLAFRLELWRRLVDEYAVGVALAVGIVSAMLVAGFRYDSTVVKYERLQAVVVSIYEVPLKGFSPSHYMVKLSDSGQLVTIEDRQLREVGSVIKVERRTRKNGVVTYHLVPPGCETPDCAAP